MAIRVALLLLLSSVLSLSETRPAPTSEPRADYSGTYTFLREGETLQLNIDADQVRGFITRYGTLDSDKDAFIDQFFKSGKLDGQKLSWQTAVVHGIWYEFSGTVDRGAAKSKAEEGFYEIHGTLTEHRSDADDKVTSRQREVSFKLLPE
jgi:hypothetical protein